MKSTLNATQETTRTFRAAALAAVALFTRLRLEREGNFLLPDVKLVTESIRFELTKN